VVTVIENDYAASAVIPAMCAAAARRLRPAAPQSSRTAETVLPARASVRGDGP